MTSKIRKIAKLFTAPNNPQNTGTKNNNLAEISAFQLAAIVKFSNDAIISKDLDGIILTWNKAAEKIFGYTADEAIGQNISIIFPPELLSEESVILTKIKSGERIEHYETVRKKKDGSFIPISLTVSPIKNDKGEIIGVSKIARDISEQKLAEKLLSESESRFRHLADNAPVLIWMSGTDKLCNYFNKYWLDFTGRTFEEENGNGWTEGVHPDDFDLCLEIYTKNFDARKEFEMEYRLKNADGEYRWILDKGAPRFTLEGIFLGFIGSCIDITERKIAEENIKDSEQKLRRVLDNLFIFVGLSLPDGTLVEVNHAPLEAAQVSLDEVVGKKTWDTIWVNHNSEVQRQMREDFKKAAQGEIVRHDMDVQIIGGQIITIDYMLAPVRDVNGKITHLLSSGADITERKRAEEILRKSELRYRTLFDSIDEGFCLLEILFDEKGKANDYSFLEINPAFEKLTGISAAAALGESSVRKLIPDLEEKWFEIYGRVALTGEPIRFIDNSEAMNRWFDVSAFRVGDSESRKVAVLFNNITERKLAEKSLRESEERYRLLFENNPFPMWVYELETLKFITVNDATAAHYGYTKEEFLTMTIKDIRPAEDIPALLKDISETVPQLNNAGVWKHRKKDGSIIYVDINSHPINLDGKAARLVLANDISERKLAESALREKESQLHASDQRLAAIVQGMTEACFALDAEWKFTFANDNTETLLGYKREALLGKSIWEVFSKLVGTPIEQNYRRAMNERVRISFEAFSPIAERWLDIRIFPSGDGIAAFLLDIQERKKNEEALKNSEHRFRAILEHSSDGISLIDTNNKILYLSPSVKYVEGYEPEELIGHSGIENTHPEDLPLLFETVEKLIANPRKPIPVEWRRRHKDGHWLWLEGFATNLLDDPAVGAIVTNYRDISERKQSEQKIFQLNESLERRVNERTSELNAVNKELAAFSYAVSHDLRAPLRAMDGFSLAVLEDYGNKLDAEGQRYLQRIRNGSQQMAQLIDDMLKLSRVTRAEISKEMVNLSEIAELIVNNLRENQPREGVSFQIEKNIEVKGDERLLRIALENLIGNAYKFTSKRQDAEIIIGQKQINEEIVYFVKDNGAGFDMTYADKLFGAFQRFHNSKDFEGTGIGLATVQRVINRHGGRIYAESKVGEGSIFYFTIN